MADNSKESMALIQKQLMFEQAKNEQEFAKIDRLMNARKVAFALATEAVKAKGGTFSIDEIITESKKVEAYLSEGAGEYLALAKKINDNDEEQDKIVLASVN